MQYELYYGNFPYTVESNPEDILSFEFQKNFNVEYSQYFALYTDLQKEFIKDFNTKWLNNEIHDYDYYTTLNYEFLDWLKNKYYDDAEEAQGHNVEEDCYTNPDDWWNSLDFTVKVDIMYNYDK